MIILDSFCPNVVGLRVVYFIMEMLGLIFRIVPIVLILLLTIDIFKNIIGASDDLSKLKKSVINRILSCILLFFVPNTVNNFNMLLGNLGVEYSQCLIAIKYGVAPDEGNKYYDYDNYQLVTNKNPLAKQETILVEQEISPEKFLEMIKKIVGIIIIQAIPQHLMMQLKKITNI